MSLPKAFKIIEELLLKSAPTVAGALGGPAAGMVTSALENAFTGGGKPVDSIINGIVMDPNAESKLQDLEAALSDGIKALGPRQPSSIKITIEINFPSQQ